MTDAAVDGGGPPYRLTYPITADAAIDAARVMMGPLRRRMTIVSAVAITLGIVVTFAGDLVFGPAIVLFGLLSLAMTVLRGPERWLVSRRARNVIGGTAELIFADSGVGFGGSQASGRIPWSALTEVREDARTVVLLRHGTLAGYAPAAAFGSPERRAEIVAFARARIRAAATEAAAPA